MEENNNASKFIQILNHQIPAMQRELTISTDCGHIDITDSELKEKIAALIYKHYDGKLLAMGR
ncbi:hypothetical protein JFY47_02285 [Enterobacter asburiae]|uniref:hypothetical protein n=1 Tax=Enterobacter asburiae TaxID=61645 RepID=UPI0018E9BEA8|nr:hypothetical protein [Enterobacter asburiae]MBJ3779356.1 hypothetical protein [Enterobacter asburiae]